MVLSFAAQFRGELAALTAAFIWAIASVIYIGVGKHLSPLLLNLVKGLIAIVLLVLTLLLQGELLPAVQPLALGLLLLSGVIGIGFGDTAYFESLNRLGARRSLVLESLAPPLAAILALVFLQERLGLLAWLGIGLTIAGVTWVIVERTSDSSEPDALSASQFLPGVGYGLLAAIGQAGGAVLSRAALMGSEINPLWSTLIRLLAGAIVLILWVFLQRRSPQELRPLRSRRLLGLLIVTAFASTYVAIWLQQTSLKFAPAGIAQALSATSPLFVIPLAAATGEKVSFRAVLGVLVALAGVWLLFQRS